MSLPFDSVFSTIQQQVDSLDSLDHENCGITTEPGQVQSADYRTIDRVLHKLEAYNALTGLNEKSR